MFEVHKLNELGMRKAVALENEFNRFLVLLEDISGTEGREMSIVRTKLEEASFFAKRAMVLAPENQLKE